MWVTRKSGTRRSIQDYDFGRRTIFETMRKVFIMFTGLSERRVRRGETSLFDFNDLQGFYTKKFELKAEI
jgi:hypothetical protein